MYYLAHQNAAASKITVTNTATGIYDLINTAGSTNLPRAGFPVDTNAIDITVEDGDIRVLWDGNTPTAANGILLSSGNVYYFRGLPLENMKLIRVSGDVVCSVAPGKSDRGESTNASAFGVTLEAGDIELGAVELKNASTDERAEIVAANAGSTTATKVLKVQPIDEAGNVIEGGGGGGSAGGGNNTYSTEQQDFTATVTDATNDIVLSVDSIGGSLITEANFANAILKVIKASDGSVNTITLDDIDWTSATKTLDTSACTGAFTFATGDIVSLTLVGPDKGMTSEKFTKVQDQSPLNKQHTPDTFTLTNVPNATPNETIIIDLSDYRGWSVHVEKTGGADTFDVDYFVSNEDALATADWLEITPTFASGSAAADHIAHPASELLVMKALKLKITTAGGGNDADFQVFTKRWY